MPLIVVYVMKLIVGTIKLIVELIVLVAPNSCLIITLIVPCDLIVV